MTCVYLASLSASSVAVAGFVNGEFFYSNVLIGSDYGA